MKTAQLLTTAAFAVALVSPIAVQAQPAQPSPQAPPAAEATPPAPPPAAATGVAAPAAAVTRDPNAPLGSDANPVPLSSPTPVGQASSLVAGDPTVVSNAPIPDTKANRALYGQPLSATGRASKPAGN